MDRIIALYASHELAAQIRTQLVADGFAADRVDVTSLVDLGRATAMPSSETRGKLDDYFRSLFTDLDDKTIVERLAGAVSDGSAAVTVHPRGEVEIARAQRVLKSHEPIHLFARITPPEAQGRLLGERAAGRR